MIRYLFNASGDLVCRFTDSEYEDIGGDEEHKVSHIWNTILDGDGYVVESEEDFGTDVYYDIESGTPHTNYSLVIYTDAEDTYQPSEGVPDIAADGTSFCSIIVQKQNRHGVLVEDSDIVIASTTRGYLSELSKPLVNGEAMFVLRSVPETCVATVTVTSEDLSVIPGSIDIQFAPVVEEE